MKALLHCAAMILICAVNVQADCPPPTAVIATPTDALDRLTNAGFSIRKSFVGKKDENQPASISYATASENGAFYNIDFAIRHRGIDCTYSGVTDTSLR